MLYRLVVGIAPHCIVTRQRMVLHGTRGLARGYEVDGELAGDLMNAGAKGRRLSLRDATMQAHATGLAYPLRKHVETECVGEAIASGQRSVRPLLHSGGVEELPSPHEALALLLERIRFDLQSRCHGRDRKLTTHDTGCLEQALIGSIEGFDLSFDGPAKALGRR